MPMKPPRWFIEVMIVVVACSLGYVAHHPTPPSIREAHTVSQATEQVKAMRDTVVVYRDRVLTKTLVAYDTVRVAENIHDTVWVKQFVAACDSLASDCRAFRVAARNAHDADSTVILALHAEVAAYKADRPSGLKRFVSGALKVGAGLGVGYLAGKVLP